MCGVWTKSIDCRTLVPDGNTEQLKDARFGSSIACLGQPDTKLESTTLVVVGAPHFGFDK